MIHVFIVNSIVCERDFAQKLRIRLARIPKLNYYVLSTREAGHERELVELLCHFFDNDTIRFYCCGGSGTMRNMLNGLHDLSNVEVALVPYGSCDFLKCFDYSYDRFRDIESLINGEVVYVDYIKTNVGIALNSVSLGLDSEVAYIGENYRTTGMGLSNMAYKFAVVHACLLSSNKTYDIELDGENFFSSRVTEFFLGNGWVLGGAVHMGISKDYTDGLASYCLVENKSSVQRFGVFKNMLDPDMKRVKEMYKTGMTTKARIRRENGSIFYINLDGEIVNTHELRAELVKQGLRFVLPKGGPDR